ncbi:Phage shock protein E precursor-related protein [Trichomonas vaginalis G3]|uniref:Phage shock protein E-related protein n=1 Tax=Trichomonas vaginalis (strain ATCC PRA-98 / G3) TaxID=412133 RepID=A2FI91_TRIV3|nr:rhodanese homology domain (RHOD) domain-containing protein [Trichomonas vaginalis G3]EAX95373.1 Phage shock protein E precursor-related protein [Trichomonas vaginalis G3]KAI5510741.1 rhodanese homology domain (RHOD) domain-containing protein [Trichomonas vaginalis G3]|eukprot:XP_001308303.1 Phage shock protein E precursor-related protein [Trichomonas vaginalis G3]
MSFDSYFPGGVILDVRANDEWDAGHIEGAIHIPSYEVESRITDEIPDKKTPINIHCAAGGRAGEAKNTLLAMGYQNVANIGGYEDAQKLSKENH